MPKGDYHKGKGKGITLLRSLVANPPDHCVLWQMCVRRGYGIVGYLGKRHSAHRFVCELYHGPAPSPDHHAAHSCGQSLCVNPLHVSWKTPSENEQDKITHGTNGRKTGQHRFKIGVDEAAQIRAMKGKTVPQIAAQFGISEQTVRHVRAGRRWTPDGSKHRKFTAVEIAQIKGWRGLRTQKQIGDHFGVDAQVINRIQNGCEDNYLVVGARE